MVNDRQLNVRIGQAEKKALKNLQELYPKLSQSDIVRLALLFFQGLTPEERDKYIISNMKRG